MDNGLVCLTGPKVADISSVSRRELANYPIPLEALDDRLGWIGTSGSGKTYNAGSGVERLLESGARVVIVDPLDVWWGLRLTAAGGPSTFTLPAGLIDYPEGNYIDDSRN